MMAMPKEDGTAGPRDLLVTHVLALRVLRCLAASLFSISQLGVEQESFSLALPHSRLSPPPSSH